jgi:hypothetical protein
MLLNTIICKKTLMLSKEWMNFGNLTKNFTYKICYVKNMK